MDVSAPAGQEQTTQQLPSSPGKQFSEQLAAAVRSINWTYAIFWSISTSRPGVLTWKDGFYNGEVKTRKFTNSTDFAADDCLVLRRSEQLRELYESLLSGECDQRARRPAASLSPEELGDAEWYYTACMTYAFPPGQGLPGKSFASNEHVWLCNAQFADTKTFQRALLAKTASIQTVACIPFIGGVLELGTTGQVLEDVEMVNRIGTSFWELQVQACSNTEEPSCRPSKNATGEADMLFEDTSQSAPVGLISREIECLPDGNLEWIMKDMDEFYGLHEELDVRALDDNWLMDGSFAAICSQEAAPPAPDTDGVTDDLSILSTSDVPSRSSSCFTPWKRLSGPSGDTAVLVVGESQKLLKKVVARFSCMNDGGGTARVQESNVKGHVMSERRRREKLNDMFLILKSSVPSIQKVDKISILAETIAYLKELRQRIKELECSKMMTRQITGTPSQRQCDVTGKNIPAGSKRKVSELR